MSDCIYYSTLKQTGTHPLHSNTHTHTYVHTLVSCVLVLLNPQCVAVSCHLARLGIHVEKSPAFLPCLRTLSRA